MQDAPFFTVKLGIRVLPCIVLFKHGRVVSKIVGFDQLGGKDDFSTASLEKQLQAAGLTTSSSSKAGARRDESDEEEEEPDAQKRSIRSGFHNNQRTASDEDSDFE
jgi:thioredoxin-like negative regulator of GroEL